MIDDLELLKPLMDLEITPDDSSSDENPLTAELITSIISGKLSNKQLDKLISNGLDLEFSNYSINTPLAIALIHKQYNIAKKLLNKGANPNINLYGDEIYSAVTFAVKYKKLDLLESLIKAGLDPNYHKTLNGQHPLHLAAKMGLNKFIKLLVENKFDVNQKEVVTPFTPLYYALKPDTQETLLKLGAKIESWPVISNDFWSDKIPFNDKELLFTRLLECGAKEVNVEKFLKDRELSCFIINEKDCRQELHSIYKIFNEYKKHINEFHSKCIANLHKNFENINSVVIETFLNIFTDSPTDINQKDENGDTSLILFSYDNDINKVKYLIGKGANVNQANNEGFSSLSIASQNANEDIVKLLIDNGADVNQTNDNGDSPAFIASARGYKNVLKLLLEAGAYVNQVNYYGVFPLYLACQNGKEDIVRLLIDHGADVNQTNNSGGSPLFVASYQGYEEIVKLLIGAGATLETKFIGMLNKTNNSEIFKLLAKACLVQDEHQECSSQMIKYNNFAVHIEDYIELLGDTN